MISILKKTKRLIISFLYNFIYLINFKRKFKKFILFESNPDYTDSPKAVFDKMIELGINKEYKLIWLVKDIDKFNNFNINNVLFIHRSKKIRNRIKCFYYIFNAKYIIDCNSYIKKINKYQTRVYLTHGMAIKNVSTYFQQIGKVDFISVSSKWFIPITADLYKTDKSKVIATGLPRNDCFFLDNDLEKTIVKKFFGLNNYIVWLPTYRNHKNKRFDSTFNINTDFTYGVPILDEKTIVMLNDVLKRNDLLLYIKLHPAENIDNINKKDLSNIIFINSEYLSSLNLSINQLLKYSIGLLTDYSSVYFDYSILSRPIGLTISDYDDYTKHVSLVFDLKKDIVGDYICNYDDLENFVLNINNNRFKNYISEFNRFNDYKDSCSSERVIKLLNLDMGESNV